MKRRLLVASAVERTAPTDPRPANDPPTSPGHEGEGGTDARTHGGPDGSVRHDGRPLPVVGGVTLLPGRVAGTAFGLKGSTLGAPTARVRAHDGLRAASDRPDFGDEASIGIRSGVKEGNSRPCL